MTTSPATVPESTVHDYDLTTDVLVVGFGCAGASAAIEAARAGAEVPLLDRAGGPGGASAMSGGEIYLGGGTPVQQACGFDDSAEDMFAYLSAVLGPHADTGKLRLYCDGSLEHFDWLCSHGLTFAPRLYDAPTWMPPTDDGLMWLGENAWPYTELARPVPRGHRPETEAFGGWLLMEKLADAARAEGARVELDTRAHAPVVDDTGRVVGLRARRYGDEITVRARRGVVLTTGGFVDDEEMLAHHAPHLVGHGKVSAGLDHGDGIRMAAALGAATRRMSVTQIALSVVPAMIARGMLVNAHGQRFRNEDVYPGLISVDAVRHQPAPWWVILDEQAYDEIPKGERWGVRPQHVTETLAELEEATGMPPGALETTVGVYNEHAEHGRDPYFHKNARWLRPLRPPYAAIDTRLGFDNAGRHKPGDNPAISGFTLGGLHTDVDGVVFDVAGRPIRGLFAAGRASSGIHGENYVSGTSLGDGTFFGRRAGRAAAGKPAGTGAGA